MQVQITNDNTDIETAVSKFVSAYNAVINDINGQEKNDSSGNAEPLFGSPTLALIQSQLTGALFTGAASGAINNITQLGIGLNNDGTLDVEYGHAQFGAQLQLRRCDRVSAELGSFGQTLAASLNNLGTQAPNGAIFLAQQQNSCAGDGAEYRASPTRMPCWLTQKTQLTDELNTANQILQSIPSQLNQVNEMYSAITGYNQNPNG